MKEYAETMMNELLSWYGYEKLNEFDCEALNLCLFSSEYTPRSSSKNENKVEDMTLFSNKKLSLASSSLSCLTSSPYSSPSTSYDTISRYSIYNIVNDKTRNVVMKNNLNNDSGDIVPESECCFQCRWCHKIERMENLSSKWINNKNLFCSEICFAQFHAPPLKNNDKKCDWCHCVKETVTNVDFQDGSRQYQFCSDTCLNQFKLDIFYQETKEYLEMHPYHDEEWKIDTKSDHLISLITPDLWLRNHISSNSSTDSDNLWKSYFPTNNSGFSFTMTTNSNCTATMARITTTTMTITSNTTATRVTSFACNVNYLSRPNAKLSRINVSPSKRKKKKNLISSLSSSLSSLHGAQNGIKIENSRNDDVSLIAKSTLVSPNTSFKSNFSNTLPGKQFLTSPHFQIVTSKIKKSKTMIIPKKNITDNPLWISSLLPRSVSTTGQYYSLTAVSSFFSTSTTAVVSSQKSYDVRSPLTLISTSTFEKSLIPPSSSLFPYAILLPLPIVIPLSVPLPMSVPFPVILRTKKKNAEEDERNRIKRKR